MKAIDQNQLLDALEQQAEQHIAEAIRVFQNLNEAVLQQPAANGGWSMAQCLAHLNTYGSYYLPRIKDGLNRHRHQAPLGTFKSTWLGHKFIQMMNPAAGSKKYKAAKQHVPPAIPDAHAVVGEFIRQQEELLVYLRQARQANLDAIRIPTSILKLVRLKLGDVLQFLLVHNERHLQQARRNLPALQATGSSAFHR